MHLPEEDAEVLALGGVGEAAGRDHRLRRGRGQRGAPRAVDLVAVGLQLHGMGARLEECVASGRVEDPRSQREHVARADVECKASVADVGQLDLGGEAARCGEKALAACAATAAIQEGGAEAATGGAKH